MLSITCCLLIFLFVKHELSYDQFSNKGNPIYRVLRNAKMNREFSHVPYTSRSYALALANDFIQGIEATKRVKPTNALLAYQNILAKYLIQKYLHKNYRVFISK